MNNAIAVMITLLYIVIVATLVIKKYNSVFVFLVSGMVIRVRALGARFPWFSG